MILQKTGRTGLANTFVSTIIFIKFAIIKTMV